MKLELSHIFTRGVLKGSISHEHSELDEMT